MSWSWGELISPSRNTFPSVLWSRRQQKNPTLTVFISNENSSTVVVGENSCRSHVYSAAGLKKRIFHFQKNQSFMIQTEKSHNIWTILVKSVKPQLHWFILTNPLFKSFVQTLWEQFILSRNTQDVTNTWNSSVPVKKLTYRLDPLKMLQ